MGALIRNGYRIALPFGENHRYDLIADDGERLYRVHVKTGRLRNGEIDFLAVYCPQTKEVYLVPESELVQTRGHLRVDPTVNRQNKRIRWARRFKLA
jgi:hypothetical protein